MNRIKLSGGTQVPSRAAARVDAFSMRETMIAVSLSWDGRLDFLDWTGPGWWWHGCERAQDQRLACGEEGPRSRFAVDPAPRRHAETCATHPHCEIRLGSGFCLKDTARQWASLERGGPGATSVVKLRAARPYTRRLQGCAADSLARSDCSFDGG